MFPLSGAVLVSSLALAFGACGSTDSAATPDSGVSARADTGPRNVGGDAASTLAPCVTTLGSKLLCWGDVTWLANGGAAMINPCATAITTDGTAAFTGAVQTAIGEAHACAVVQKSAAKEVWCWGHNTHGQLGTGDLETKRYPVKVAGLSSPTKVIAFGKDDNSAATCVLDDGKVLCFGSNGTGQLGQGSTGAPVLSPKLVTRMGGSELSGVVDIVGGSQDSMGANVCALLKDHTVLCWGKGFTASPTPYGPSNVASLGNIEGGLVRYLTSDGQYHVDTSSRTPDCGEQG